MPILVTDVPVGQLLTERPSLPTTGRVLVRVPKRLYVKQCSGLLSRRWKRVPQKIPNPISHQQANHAANRDQEAYPFSRSPHRLSYPYQHDGPTASLHHLFSTDASVNCLKGPLADSLPRGCKNAAGYFGAQGYTVPGWEQAVRPPVEAPRRDESCHLRGWQRRAAHACDECA